MNQYVIYTDGVATWRDGVRSGRFVIDVTLTVTGFAGTEDLDWENIVTH